jgi:hypothetical protein
MCRRPLHGSLPALANALYDATGVWFTKLPFTAARVLAGLKAAGVVGGVTGAGGRLPARAADAPSPAGRQS